MASMLQVFTVWFGINHSTWEFHKKNSGVTIHIIAHWTLLSGRSLGSFSLLITWEIWWFCYNFGVNLLKKIQFTHNFCWFTVDNNLMNQNILSRASEAGSPKNRLGSGPQRDTGQWPFSLSNRWTRPDTGDTGHWSFQPAGLHKGPAGQTTKN